MKTHFVDLMERSAALGELRRFSQKFGVEKLIDRESKRFAEIGLRTALYGEEKWLSILIDEPLILRQPLVRCANKVSIGISETEWKNWLT